MSLLSQLVLPFVPDKADAIPYVMQGQVVIVRCRRAALSKAMEVSLRRIRNCRHGPARHGTCDCDCDCDIIHVIHVSSSVLSSLLAFQLSSAMPMVNWVFLRRTSLP